MLNFSNPMAPRRRLQHCRRDGFPLGRPRGAAQDAGLLAHRFLGTLARCFAAENGNEPGEQIGGLIAEELIAEDDPEVAGLVASWLTMLAETVWVRVRDAYPEQADVHGL